MKLITVFFDLEAPFLWKKASKFDEEKVVRDISEVLNRFKIKAVFNTCGILAENFPELVSNLHDEGHEIASHGYAHENFLKLSVTKLDEVLAKTEKILLDILGERPIGIRSPWVFRNEKIYSVLNKRNYRWASNWYVHFPRAHFHKSSYPRRIIGETLYNLKWIFHKKAPFRIGNVMEIPLLSPLDIICIYPSPEPTESSPMASLEEAYRILVKHYRSSKKYFNLNFHPHAIGTCNRIELLNNIFDHLSNQSDVRFVLPYQIIEHKNE